MQNASEYRNNCPWGTGVYHPPGTGMHSPTWKLIKFYSRVFIELHSPAPSSSPSQRLWGWGKAGPESSSLLINWSSWEPVSFWGYLGAPAYSLNSTSVIQRNSLGITSQEIPRVLGALPETMINTKYIYYTTDISLVLKRGVIIIWELPASW